MGLQTKTTRSRNNCDEETIQAIIDWRQSKRRQRLAMNSSTSRADQDKQRKEEILRQISSLQAQLHDLPPDQTTASHVASPQPYPTSPKRKAPDSNVLVPATPPSKKRRVEGTTQSKPATKPLVGSTQITKPSQRELVKSAKTVSTTQPSKPAPSSFLSSLARFNTGDDATADPTEQIVRSAGFTETPASTSVDQHPPTVGRIRDDRLALIEDLEPGPAEHCPPSDDPTFQKLEPNSGIRLSSRSVPHEDLQLHLTGRYYLSPSLLYSVVQLLPNKQGYDVPVVGDWITIAVVAERGPLKYSRAPVAAVSGNPDEAEKKSYAEKKKEEQKPTGKKYVNFKLIDFGARARSSSSATGGKAVIRGDAFLSLLLFEADSFDLISDDGDTKPKKRYRGGSKGAFESMSKLKEGDVVALLNPRILKPFQRSNDIPHPTSNILALTPDSAASIMTIGRAQDLGMCSAVKKNGETCGSWYDKRTSTVCEWHIQSAVERSRAGRAEFSSATTGLSTTAVAKRKPNYDPKKQWGLQPAEDSSSTGSTYIVSGHIVSGSKYDSRTLYATENIGREGQAKAQRKVAQREAEKALESLLSRDKQGMAAVMKAREGKQAAKTGATSQETDQSAPTTSKRGYSVQLIKQLGFDPSTRPGQRKLASDDAQKKLDGLAAIQANRKEISLAPKPGPKIRSGVTAPSAPSTSADTEEPEMIDLDSD